VVLVFVSSSLISKLHYCTSFQQGTLSLNCGLVFASTLHSKIDSVLCTAAIHAGSQMGLMFMYDVQADKPIWRNNWGVAFTGDITVPSYNVGMPAAQLAAAGNAQLSSAQLSLQLQAIMGRRVLIGAPGDVEADRGRHQLPMMTSSSQHGQLPVVHWLHC
jgi:hypothetical protein